MSSVRLVLLSTYYVPLRISDRLRLIIARNSLSFAAYLLGLCPNLMRRLLLELFPFAFHPFMASLNSSQLSKRTATF